MCEHEYGPGKRVEDPFNKDSVLWPLEFPRSEKSDQDLSNKSVMRSMSSSVLTNSLVQFDIYIIFEKKF